MLLISHVTFMQLQLPGWAVKYKIGAQAAAWRCHPFIIQEEESSSWREK